MNEKDKMPIALLIGRGSRIPALLEHLDATDARAQVVAVVSHKALDPDGNGNKTLDVPGIQEAKKRDIPTVYFNFVQMRNAIQKVNSDLTEEEIRKEYFRSLGAFLSQNYPIKPQAIFMLGWDLITSEEFLKFFPGNDSFCNVINLHPAQLPDNKNDKTIKLPSGIEIPVLEGEHDQVINEAIRLKLPVLGACMHFAQPVADQGGSVIKRIEVPINYLGIDQATFDDYEKRLQVAESQLVIEVVDLFAKRKIKIENGKVEIV